MKPMTWILFGGLLLSFAGQAMSSDCGKHTNLQPHVCAEVKKLLTLRRGGRAPENVPRDFMVEYQSTDGSDSYPNIDIDGDGIHDQIVRGCGAGRDALCTLTLDLSDGKHFELEEGRFFLARVKSSIYVIVGDGSEPEANKRCKRRVYQITKQNIKLICPRI